MGTYGQKHVSLIVTETNKYGSEKADACHSGASRLRAWAAVDLPEFYCFLAIVLLMGLVQKNTLQDYWSTDPMLKESRDPNIGTVQDPDLTTKMWKTNHRQPAATDSAPLPREGASDLCPRQLHAEKMSCVCQHNSSRQEEN
ncbi:hypothetical protein HPB49_016916 [Dermacentor silvarum]|uniref:Uncharacterized protein n=1 Tax=Dermacentor silvarum TaxID=543639 RepID=A0ACB8D6L9_DERSI|nr:hypothetical protein HPB49_016916 [Dermacentor silvarum]